MALSGADIKRIRDIFAEMVLPSPDVEIRLRAVENTTDKLSNILCGNGEKGMDETVRDIEGRLDRLEHKMGVIDSNLTEVKKSVDKLSGYQGVMYDEKTHPGRRAGDEGAEKPAWFEKWEKIGWGIVEKAVTAAITVIILLAVSHWTELFP